MAPVEFVVMNSYEFITLSLALSMPERLHFGECLHSPDVPREFQRRGTDMAQAREVIKTGGYVKPLCVETNGAPLAEQGSWVRLRRKA